MCSVTTSLFRVRYLLSILLFGVFLMNTRILLECIHELYELDI